MTTFCIAFYESYLSTIWTVWVFDGFICFFFDFAESSKAFLAESSNHGVYLYIDSYSGPNFTPLTVCCRSGFGQIRIRYPTQLVLEILSMQYSDSYPLKVVKFVVDHLYTSSSKIESLATALIWPFFVGENLLCETSAC
jgi:hypothetical protein